MMSENNVKHSDTERQNTAPANFGLWAEVLLPFLLLCVEADALLPPVEVEVEVGNPDKVRSGELTLCLAIGATG